MNSPAPVRERLAIIHGLRTPFCKAGTGLASLSAVELGRQAVNALLTRTGVEPTLIDEVIFGCVAQPMDAANIARVIALRAGIAQEVPAMTVQRNCASGFEALLQADLRLQAGRGALFVVGGTESMSQVPLLLSREMGEKLAALSKARTTMKRVAAMANFRPGDFHPIAGLQLGLTDPVSGLNMGETAERLARERDISREAQDAFALRSHQRAVAARGKHAEEITPVFLPDGTMVVRDNGPREDTSAQKLAALKPMFDRLTGTVTAGNSSQITDGAVALLVMGETRARELGLPPLGYLVDWAVTGCDPGRMGLGPISATRRLLERGYDPARADLIEINEAFAAQVLAVIPEIPGLAGADDPRLNPNGGSIALGHPVGATGARLVLTALRELERTGKRSALLTLCVGGGQGSALWIERPDFP